MRPSVRRFAEEVATRLPLPEPIVQVGARPAEGQEDIADLRTLFAGRDYLGVDLQEGPGVDQVEDVHALSFADASIGTVVAFDTLEHVADPHTAMREIHRVLKPGGVVAISSVMFFVIHAHPWDYWRFTPEGFGLLLERFEQRLVLAQGDPLLPQNVFGVGIKGPTPHLSEASLPDTVAAGEAWGAGKPVALGPMRMSLPGLWKLTLRETAKAARRRGRSRQEGRA